MATSTDFDALFGSHYPRLVRALGVAYDPEAAADAVQDAFVEADRRWAKVSTYDDPVGWIRRVALNRLRNGRRNRLRRAEILSTVRAVAPDDLLADLVDLRRAVETLPERMRLTICLHYLAELSVAEVADTLDVSTGTVKSNLHDARHRLRTTLEVRHG